MTTTQPTNESETMLSPNQRFTVVFNKRSCAQYANKAAAEKHAEDIGGEVVIRKYAPQYWKTIKVRGNQERTKLFGIKQSSCSKQMAKTNESK